jgi:hypothetical protein
MTKLPPGQSCFPNLLGGMESNKRKMMHSSRYLQVRQLRELSDGKKRTWASIWETVAATEGIDGQTVRNSYRIVQRAIKAGKGSQFLGALSPGWPLKPPAPNTSRRSKRPPKLG